MMKTHKNNIVTEYARMWPREVFAPSPTKKGKGMKNARAKDLPFLGKPGVYILYKDDRPFYIGQAKILWKRLRTHARQIEDPYFHFWNFFSAFAVNPSFMKELEGILIAAMPTANGAKPKLPKEKMPEEVTNLLREIYDHRL